MSEHANRVAKGVVSAKEGIHEEVLLMPFGVRVADKEAGHVISKGTDDIGPELTNEVLVDKVVESDVEPGRAQDTPSTRAFGAEGDTKDGIPFGIMVLIETRGRGTIVDGEVGVGLGPVGSDTVEDSLAM
jgi:hypothetical protein